MEKKNMFILKTQQSKTRKHIHNNSLLQSDTIQQVTKHAGSQAQLLLIHL